MEEKWKQVPPALPVAPYIGGKKQLSGLIIRLIERIDHSQYAEPFIGMGGVFLRRRRVPKAEVVNDISADVSTFFRILQRHYVPFLDMLRYQFTSRREFARLLATDPATLTDLERAARFLYLQRIAFGGKVAGRIFGVSAGYPGRFDVSKLVPMLEELNDRLAGVIIENLPYGDFIRRYDTPETLFYLDPPYYGCEGDYGAGVFARSDFEVLAELLVGIQGNFILSINDLPQVREIFAAFDFREVSLTYTVNDTGPTSAQELIITPKGMRLRPEPQGNLFSSSEM